ncbi:MAG: hypothetical protein ACI87N_001291 [Flavobacteriales bacterium]|jgi:hypothetical protein
MVLFINVIIFTHLELWTNKKTTILIQLLPKKKGLLNISSPNQNQTKPNQTKNVPFKTPFYIFEFRHL